MDLIRAMRLFRRVVELRQFTAAAREDGRSTASVSKEIADLEEHLRTKLLHRTTRRVSPTTAGAEYYERCVRILDEIDEVEQSMSASGSAPAGTLRMNVPLSFGLSQISPLVPEMLARWPALRLDLSFTDRFVDVVEERADLVIRIATRLPDSSLVAHKLARARVVLCASPDYLERRGVPRTIADLADHEHVVYGLGAEPGTWSLGASDDARVRARGRLRVDSSLVIRDAVLAGVGITLLPSFYVADELDSGRLRALLEDHPAPPAVVYALHARGKHVGARLRPVIELLRERFARARWAVR